jgi:diguanylate cyclase (GGDEF)-like protein
VYRFRKENYGVRYKTLLHTQSIIILNILFITSAFNIFQNEKMVMVHIYIIAYVFISIVLHIPSANLALIGLISLFLNIIGILMYHFDPLIVQFEIINLLIFIGLSWWLGIIANRNRILLWMNLNKERELNSKLADLNKRDSMTNFFNHEYIFELLDQEIERAHLLEQCLSIAIFDLDDFKRINDTYGHQVGDYVLITAVEIIKTKIRSTDIFARWGGEEFMVLFPGADLEVGVIRSEIFRKTLAEYDFIEPHTVTGSFGVTSFKENDTMDSFIKRADEALYAAKRNGRNRVEALN